MSQELGKQQSEFGVIAANLSERVENFKNLSERLRKVSQTISQRPPDDTKPSAPLPAYGADIIGVLKQGLQDISILEQKIRDDVNYLESLVG